MWDLGFYNLEALGVLMCFDEFLARLWLMLLCYCLCLIQSLSFNALDENHSMTFALESESEVNFIYNETYLQFVYVVEAFIALN
jgi:hypothetical protein